MKKDYLGTESVVNFAMSAESIGLIIDIFVGDKKAGYSEYDVKKGGWK